MRARMWIVLFATGIAAGCHGMIWIGQPPIVGSGVSKEETRTVDAFHALQAGSALQVNVQVNPGAKPSVKLSGDDNLVPLVESVVHDGKLILRLKDDSSISPKLPLIAEVVHGELDEVEASGAAVVKVKGVVKAQHFSARASGAAQVSVDGLDSPQAVAGVSGASHAVLTGSVASLQAEASGASQIKALELQLENAQVSISGASIAVLRPSKSVSGDLSGASRLELHGHPAKNTVSTSGASEVIENK